MSLASLHLFASACSNATGISCNTGLPTVKANSANLQSLLQIVFAIFGAVTVLVIVIAALNMVNAEGNPQKIATARSAMIYALIGLVVAISAEVIVTFVVGNF